MILMIPSQLVASGQQRGQPVCEALKLLLAHGCTLAIDRIYVEYLKNTVRDSGRGYKNAWGKHMDRGKHMDI